MRKQLLGTARMQDQRGTSNVLKVSLQETIYTLDGRGWSRRRIARELGIDRETVGRYLRLAKPAISTPGSEEASEVKPAISTSGNGVGRKSQCEPLPQPQAALKAKIKPGDLAVVMGVGSNRGGHRSCGSCRRMQPSGADRRAAPKLDLAAELGPIRPVNVAKENLRQVIDDLTEGWGADLVFEATGAPGAIQKVHEPVCPGGTIVLVGMPIGPVGSRYASIFRRFRSWYFPFQQWDIPLFHLELSR